MKSIFELFLLYAFRTLPSGKKRNSSPKVLELERIILIQRLGAKNQPNKQHNKRPDAGRPTVKEMYWAEELIPKSVQSRNFEKEILVLPKPQCWRPYIAKSQQRPFQE